MALFEATEAAALERQVEEKPGRAKGKGRVGKKVVGLEVSLCRGRLKGGDKIASL